MTLTNSMLEKYVTNATHHGHDDADSSYCHWAYNYYVKRELINIAQNYNLPVNVEHMSIDEAIQWRNTLRTSELSDLQADILRLNQVLREMHKDGIDLYLKNNYNTITQDYITPVNNDMDRVYEEYNEFLDSKKEYCQSILSNT